MRGTVLAGTGALRKSSPPVHDGGSLAGNDSLPCLVDAFVIGQHDPSLTARSHEEKHLSDQLISRSSTSVNVASAQPTRATSASRGTDCVTASNPRQPIRGTSSDVAGSAQPPWAAPQPSTTRPGCGAATWCGWHFSSAWSGFALAFGGAEIPSELGVRHGCRQVPGTASHAGTEAAPDRPAI